MLLYIGWVQDYAVSLYSRVSGSIVIVCRVGARSLYSRVSGSIVDIVCRVGARL